MYTKRKYPFLGLIIWTRRYIYKFFLIALIPVILYEVLDWKWLYLPWLPIALIGTAVAFIIGFKNNGTYGRLWEARTIYGGIVNASRSWGIMVQDLVHDSKNDAKDVTQIKKRLIYRHIAWLTALRYNLRQERPWEIKYSNASDQEYSKRFEVPEHVEPIEKAIEPYLDETEKAQVFAKSNKATHLITLQSKDLRELKEKGHIWEFAHLEMEKMLVEFFSLQGKCERIKNFPYPRQFATLNSYYVWIFILLIPIGLMHEFNQIGQMLIANDLTLQNDLLNYIYRLVAQYFVWFSIPFSVLVSWIFYTLERIGEVSENPFEGNPNDVPITTLSRTIEIDLREMLGEDPASIPPPIPMKENIQM